MWARQVDYSGGIDEPKNNIKKCARRFVITEHRLKFMILIEPMWRYWMRFFLTRD